MTTYNPLNVTDISTLFERISDDPLAVNVILTNTLSVLKNTEKLEHAQSSGP